MERKGRILGGILTATSVAGLLHSASSCLPVPMPVPALDRQEVTITFDTGQMVSKAADPDETLISDVSLLIFDADGNAEECIWLPEAGTQTSVSLIKGNTYSIRACANFGYHVYADHLAELDEITYHMAYPDEYREGIPMYAALDDFTLDGGAGADGGSGRSDDGADGDSGRSDDGADGGRTVVISFQRLMAKICLRMDRSRLSDDVTMNVVAARIGNCPKSVKVIGPSSVKDHDQCFASGFSRGEFETGPLNVSGPGKVSGEVALYMLENMQGDISPALTYDQEKVFPADDPRYGTCSYVELELEYMSESKYTLSKNLKYRFYLGESRNNLDVERNCRYGITVTPRDDGLSGDGWRVDKSGILDRGPISFEAYPSKYIRGNIGDVVHIWCEVSPYGTPFDVGLDYMEDDKAEGIYDYEIDPDGHGATLTLTGPGTGLIYMEAGEPVNDGALFIIEVNLPSPSFVSSQFMRRQ